MNTKTKAETQPEDAFIDEICAYPGGEAVRLCMQCGTCTASCANASKMDYSVRELIGMSRAGLKKEVLSSNSSWLCLSCYLCTVRCPRGIRPTEFMHILDTIANREGMVNTRTLILYRSFVGLVHSMGTAPALYLMTLFYLRSNPFRAVKMMPLAVNLLRHKRLPIRPHRLKPEAQRQLKTILAKAKTLEESHETV
jgi:heterodisulfide reductase subunit C